MVERVAAARPAAEPAYRLRIAAFTGGRDVPSARFRVRQYIDAWSRDGLLVTEYTNLAGTYPPAARLARPVWAAANVLSSSLNVVRARGADLSLVQREFLSTYVTLERCTSAPRVLDVDDAIWAHRRGAFTARLAQLCALVICGNRFIEEYFNQLGRPTIVVPTAVDTVRFHPRDDTLPTGTLSIGWVGVSSGLRYLEERADALATALRAVPQARLRIMSNAAPRLPSVPSDRWTFEPWAADREAGFIRSLDIGIMPLADTEFERGKCSYKMLLYMSSGVPVVVSPVGMNADVLALGSVGLGPRTDREWTEALVDLATDAEWRRRAGTTGRVLVVRHFEREQVAARLAGTLASVAGSRRA